MEERISQIKERHQKGYNCAQNVMCAYADLLDVDEKTLLRISEGFGGGMGGMMEVCGAVTAMVMIAGLKCSGGDPAFCNTTPQTMKLVRELAREFQEKNGSIICRELKGVGTGRVLRDCDGCIEDAIRILGEKVFDLS